MKAKKPIILISAWKTFLSSSPQLPAMFFNFHYILIYFEFFIHFFFFCQPRSTQPESPRLQLTSRASQKIAAIFFLQISHSWE